MDRAGIVPNNVPQSRYVNWLRAGIEAKNVGTTAQLYLVTMGIVFAASAILSRILDQEMSPSKIVVLAFGVVAVQFVHAYFDESNMSWPTTRRAWRRHNALMEQTHQMLRAGISATELEKILVEIHSERLHGFVESHQDAIRLALDVELKALVDATGDLNAQWHKLTATMNTAQGVSELRDLLDTRVQTVQSQLGFVIYCLKDLCEMKERDQAKSASPE